MYALLRSRVPPCIFSMIFSLIEKRGNEYYYRSTAEIDRDLDFILSDAQNLLYDKPNEIKMHPFSFQSGKLYGRDHLIPMLKDVYERMTLPQSVSEMVIISGCSGAGKSALVQQVRQPIIKKGGYFIGGKFDNLKRMEPLSAVILAFRDFYDQIVKRTGEAYSQAIGALKEVVGPEASVLTNIIPGICQMLEVSVVETVKVGGTEARNRFKHVFRLLVRALATPSHPLVLFLDDLQWADTASLALIESLITDYESKSFLFIGTYRDDEVSETHPLAIQLRKLERKGVHTTKIKVGNLTKGHLNSMISDHLQTSLSVSDPLAEVVYRKTSGNALLVIQFLRSLYDEGFMHFSLNTRQWQWDTKVIDSKGVSDSAVKLMTRQILTFPAKTQNALKLIACLGSYTDECVLSAITADDNSGSQQENSHVWEPITSGYNELMSSLQLAIRQGIIVHTESKYKFTHDSFQHAAYSLISETERGLWHLWIGNRVRLDQTLSPEKALFITVGQLNKGAKFIDDADERVELAWLNLQAAEISISYAAFVPASFHLRVGRSLLDENCWRDQYKLCLQISVLQAEVKQCEGSFKEMDKILEEIFLNAKCLDDKIRSYFIRVRSLSAQGKQQEALEVGLLVLSLLGEPVPTSSDMRAIIKEEFLKTKQLLEGKTNDDLLSLKAMENSRKIAAMQQLNDLILFAFVARQKEYHVLVFKTIQISLCHGMCKEATIGLAMYGGLLIQYFNDIEGGYRFGQLAMSLVEKLQASACLARVYTTFHTFINSSSQHHRVSLEPLKLASQVALRVGDVEYSVMSARQYCIHSYQCGIELSTVEKIFRKGCQQMEEHKQVVVLKITLPYLQTVLNLMGQSDDPLKLIGQAMDYKNMLKEALRNKNQSVLICTIYHLQSWLAYIFNEYELASEMAAKCPNAQVLSSYPVFLKCDVYFLSGLISFAMAYKTKNEKWRIKGQSSIEVIELHAGYAPSNYQHKLFLLQAEFDSIRGKIDDAAKNYDNAVRAAGENGYVQDQALAYERAANFYMKQGDDHSAIQYYADAQNAYLRWGAVSKVNHLRENLPL